MCFFLQLGRAGFKDILIDISFSWKFSTLDGSEVGRFAPAIVDCTLYMVLWLSLGKVL